MGLGNGVTDLRSGRYVKIRGTRDSYVFVVIVTLLTHRNAGINDNVYV